MPDPRDVDLLEDVLSGSVPPEDAPASLAALATLASTLSTEVRPTAAPEDVRHRLRDALIAEMAVPTGPLDRLRDRVDRATARWRYSARVAAASAVASTMIGTTGVAAAAQAALPGDLLYGVKQLTEDARLAFASGDVDEGRLHLAFARERLEEVEDGVDRLSADTLADTLAAFDEEAAAGGNQLLAAAFEAGDDADALLAELTTFTELQTARLLEVTDQLPLAAVTAAENSVEVLRRIDAQVDALLGVACAACGVAFDVPAGPIAEAGVIPPPLVVLPADGPAAPPACNCLGGAPVDPTVPREDPTVPQEPAPQEPVDTEPDPVAPPPPVEPAPTPTEPAPGGLSDDVGQLLDPLGEVGDLVDDLLEDTGLDDTLDDVGGVVDDLTGLDQDGDGGLVDDLLGD